MTRYSFAESEGVVPLTKANDPDWCLDPANLADLFRWLTEQGRSPDPQHFLDSPWHWGPEWIEMWQQREAEGAPA